MSGIVLVLVLVLEGPSSLRLAARREAPIAVRLPGSPRVALRQQPADHPRPAPGALRDPIPDTEKITRRYADALRYFNKHLTDAEASALAQSIIAYSNRYGLDARLVVAIFVTEGSVQRVRLQDQAPAIDGRPAGERIADLCDDFRRRLEPKENASAPTMADIQRALMARAAALKPPLHGRAAERYARRVTRLFLQFCGVE